MVHVETDIEKYEKPVHESVFTGGMIDLLGIELATAFVSGLTFGIAYPWMLCWKQHWYADHTYINGKQMRFDGTGGQLIGNWLKWVFLTVITFGIYLLWIPVKVEQWTVKHTSFEGARDKESVFSGDMLSLLGIEIVSVLVTVCTLGIAYPWMLCWKSKWYREHTCISGVQLHFNGKGEQLLGNWLKWLVLTFITFGIYIFWLPIKIEQWYVKHTYAGEKAPEYIPEPSPFDGVIDWFNNWGANKLPESWECAECGYQDNSKDSVCCEKCGKEKDGGMKWKTCPSCGTLYTGTSCPNPVCGKPTPPVICRKCGRPVKDCICGSERICPDCGRTMADCTCSTPIARQQWCSRCRRWYEGSRCSWCDNIPRCSRCGRRPVMMEGEVCDFCEKGSGFFRPTDLD